MQRRANTAQTRTLYKRLTQFETVERATKGYFAAQSTIETKSYVERLDLSVTREPDSSVDALKAAEQRVLDGRRTL